MTPPAMSCRPRNLASAIQPVRQVVFSLLLALTCSISAGFAMADDKGETRIGEEIFRKQVARILVARCGKCHTAEKAEGGYSLATSLSMLKAGDSESIPLVAGKPDASELYRRIISTDEDERMPPEGPSLSADEKEAVRKWILLSSNWEAFQQSKPLADWIGSPLDGSVREHYQAKVPVTAIAISDDSQFVFVSGYGEVLVWDVETSTLKNRIRTNGRRVSALDLAPGSRMLMVVSGEPGERGIVELISLDETKPKSVVVHSMKDISSAAKFSPDGARLAVGAVDGSLVIIQTSSKEITHRLTPHADAILSLGWSQDGKNLITSSRDRTARVFDMDKVELIASYDRHERAVGGSAWGEAGPVSFDETGRLRLWTGTDNDRTVTELSGLPRFLSPILDRQAEFLIAEGGTMRRFNVDKKKVADGKDDKGEPKTKTVVSFREQPKYDSKTRAWLLSIDSNAAVIVAGTEDAQVIVWKADEAAPYKVLRVEP